MTSTPFLRQKVTLWQHADELEQEQVSMGTWIDSKDVTDCMGCGSNFTAFKRKVRRCKMQNHAFKICPVVCHLVPTTTSYNVE